MVKRLINLLLIVWAVSSPPGNAAAQVIEIPIWKDIDGRVRVYLDFENGAAFDFIVDTGAGKAMINPDLYALIKDGRVFIVDYAGGELWLETGER